MSNLKRSSASPKIIQSDDDFFKSALKEKVRHIMRPDDWTAKKWVDDIYKETGVRIGLTAATSDLDSLKDVEKIPGVYDPDTGRSCTVWRRKEKTAT